MNAILLAIVAITVGIVTAAVIGLVVKRSVVNATFTANLTKEDRGDIVALKTFLDSMRRERAEQNDAQAKRAGALEAQIRALGVSAGALDMNTRNLERALRGDAQAMGSWGEIQLKKVLEMSGLTNGISYTYQETLASEGSARRDLRTDVQVKLPNEKVIVIDSKNTLSSYLDYNAAETEESRAEQEARIIESVRNHMDEIIGAKYQKNIKNCFPKVVMYFPFEIPYLLACRAEVRIGSEKRWLREYAYENGIIFATASNLLPILEGVASIWAGQDLDKKIRKFIDEADKLCAKLSTFVENYRKIGKQLSDVGKTYREAMGQLAEGPGNVVKKLGDLKDMNVESARKLPATEELVTHANKVAESL